MRQLQLPDRPSCGGSAPSRSPAGGRRATRPASPGGTRPCHRSAVRSRADRVIRACLLGARCAAALSCRHEGGAVVEHRLVLIVGSTAELDLRRFVLGAACPVAKVVVFEETARRAAPSLLVDERTLSAVP